jgi:hypothetical protein
MTTQTNDEFFNDFDKLETYRTWSYMLQRPMIPAFKQFILPTINDLSKRTAELQNIFDEINYVEMMVENPDLEVHTQSDEATMYLYKCKALAKDFDKERFNRIFENLEYQITRNKLHEKFLRYAHNMNIPKTIKYFEKIGENSTDMMEWIHERNMNGTLDMMLTSCSARNERIDVSNDEAERQSSDLFKQEYERFKWIKLFVEYTKKK